MIIPIGIKCLNTTLKKRIKKDTKKISFGLDVCSWKICLWNFKTFIGKKINIEEIVNDHFFCCDKLVNCKKLEDYYTDSNGITSYNSKYDVIFPHDKNDEETKMKYIRRLARLKDLILLLNIVERLERIEKKIYGYDFT